MGPMRIPERLSLSVMSTVGEGEKKDGGVVEEGKKIVFVQCLFVEVKSASDKLDERQEDWLNILDKEGCARVCKFVKSKKVGR